MGQVTPKSMQQPSFMPIGDCSTHDQERGWREEEAKKEEKKKRNDLASCHLYNNGLMSYEDTEH